MIDELQVSNIALIREATLVPSAGLTVLTGETGAGKTALLSALKLILGERAEFVDRCARERRWRASRHACSTARTTRRALPCSAAFLPRVAAASRLTAASPACASFPSASRDDGSVRPA